MANAFLFLEKAHQEKLGRPLSMKKSVLTVLITLISGNVEKIERF
ncbi:hypothetical protein OAS74_00185 [bacterium]|nr:hypothetical protein [bacterium]